MRYTPVTVETTLDECGQDMPSAIVWKDQKKYLIQRIVHICQPEDLIFRYTILVGGEMRHLFYDGKEWRISKPS